MDTSQKTSFGAKLRQLRQAAGLTQEELAERAGLTAKGIGALERGDRKRPYPHTVRALAAALGLSADALADLATSVPDRGQSQPVPALPSVPMASHFPTLPSPLVGRDHDIATVMDMLSGDTRLLTLTGPGGVGKTSLAIEVGRRLHQHGGCDVTFVPLARLDDPALLLDSIAHALGLREAAERSLHEVLFTALRERSLLIVLDNVEHVLAAATDVARLLSGCPLITMLATSRSPLRIRGEREYAVAPLATPDPAAAPAAMCVADVPSVQLFVQRASAVSPSFSLTEGNAGAVAAICRRLDGLPLAIELAAARIRLLSPTALLSRLETLLPVLSGGPRDLPERQQTIRASITWSYDLLTDVEQRLFRHLSVFAGGWTLEGAEALAPSIDILTVLGRLVEASLVVRDPGEDRYRMLEPIREYASVLLEECGETVDIRDRHAAWCLALAEDAAVGLKGSGQLLWLQRLDHEHDNVRTALTWLLGRSRGQEDALRLSGALARFWFLRGHWSEGRSWLSRALDANPDDRTARRARALDEAGLIAQFQNDYAQATAFLQESIALYRQTGDRNGEASALGRLGFVAAFQNDRSLVDELNATVAPLMSHIGDKTTVGNLLIFLGLAAVIQGDLKQAIHIHDRALTVFRELGDVNGMVWTLTNMGLLLLVMGNLSAATSVLQEGLELAVRLGEPASIQYGLLGLATVASQEGHHARAARLWGAAESTRKTAGMDLNPLARAQTMYDTWVERARDEVGHDVFTCNWAAGSAMTIEETLAYATSSAQDS